MTKPSEADASGAASSALDALCRDLSEGMHAASQPLTILRASLGTMNGARQSVDDQRKLLRRLAKEVERLCVYFNYLQQFVVVEGIQADIVVETLSQLMNHALEGVDLLFAEAGVVLTLKRAGKASPCVLVDSSRLEQALSGILLVVLGRAQQGDEVIVETHGPGARIEITLTSTATPSLPSAAETKLSMALAAANLRSQGGQMAWQEQPFVVKIVLQVPDTQVPI